MKVSRREFLKTAAASSALVAIGSPAAFAATDGKADKWVKGVCRFCGTGCGVMVGVNNGKVVQVKGDPNNHNEGFLCLKGALMVPIIYAKDRVTHPMVRKNGKLTKVSWDEALNFTANKFKSVLKTDGPGAVAYYGSGQQDLEGGPEKQQRGRQPAPVHGLGRGRIRYNLRQG